MKVKRQVVFLSQRREEPHNTDIQVAQTTPEMQREMGECGSFGWARARILDVDFCVRLIDRDPFSFMRNRLESVAAIKAAMKVAKKGGATDIGLGSLVASVAHGGLDLLETADELGLRLDHGDDMSTALAAQSAWHLKELGLPLGRITVGVVGAVGIMGAGFIRLLTKDVDSFVFIVTHVDERVEHLRAEILDEATRTRRDVNVEIATSFGALKKHEDFQNQPFLVIPVGCGVLPKNMAPQGVGVNLGLGTAPEGPVAYGCMIGCVLGAHRGEVEHRVNPVEAPYARVILREGLDIGVLHQPFPVSETEILDHLRIFNLH